MTLTWLTPAALARAEERRIALAVAEVARESVEIAGGTVCWGGPDSWMNEGRGLGVTQRVTRRDVTRAIDFLRDRGSPPRFDVCPHADPRLLGMLGDRGLQAQGFETVLYRPLGEALPPPDPAFDLVRVGPDESDDYTTLVSRWLDATGDRPGRDPSHAERWAMGQVLAHPRTEAWFVRLDGRWIGGGAVEVWPGTPESGPVAALIMTAVDPAYRRRGVQRSLMLHRLARAQALGAQTATIGSDPAIATERNAIRLGFRVAYTKLTVG